jgi:hypothetical protein
MHWQISCQVLLQTSLVQQKVSWRKITFANLLPSSFTLEKSFQDKLTSADFLLSSFTNFSSSLTMLHHMRYRVPWPSSLLENRYHFMSYFLESMVLPE